MPAVDQVEICLICEAPTSEMHRGINCCRACAIFYKRTLARLEKHPLRCKGKGKCGSKKPKGMCRKCRFERFTSILASSCEGKATANEDPKEENLLLVDIKNSSPSNSPHEQEKLMQSDQSINVRYILDQMKTAYGVLCTMRKEGEMSGYSSQIREQLQQGIMKYAPATYTNVVPHAGIMFAGLLDLFRTCFNDFKSLSTDEQQHLLFTSFELMNRSDDLYRAVHYFPDDDTFMPSYTTIFSIDKIDDFLSDCPTGINKEEAKEEIINNTKRCLVVNKAHFKRLQLTLEEFLAFLGLALWKDHESISDEKMTEMVKRNRTAIMGELHKYYAAQGRSFYSARLGEVLCLLVSMEELAVQHKEDIKVYMLMNMFNEYANVK